MNIIILNGSPKKESQSVTMRHVDFIRCRFPEHQYVSLPVALKIKKLEKDDRCFNEVMKEVRQADLVLWAFPVYFYSVPGQLKRFVELIHEKGQQDLFRGKYASSLSTSAGVYDYPAHDYMQAISEDFGMQYYPGWSLKSVYYKDLMNKRKREEFADSFARLARVVEEAIPLVRKYTPMKYEPSGFVPEPVSGFKVKEHIKTLVILTDQEPESNLEKMVDFAGQYSGFIMEVVNINDLEVKCGCTGCVQCQFHGKCFIGDDVNTLFARKIMKADAVLFAMTMKDRHIAARWKTLLDRSFFMAKKNLYRNHYCAFIVSGPVLESTFINEFISIYSSSRCLRNVGYVTDESGDSSMISRNLAALMHELDQNVLQGIRRPHVFHNRAYYSAMKDLMFIYGLNSNTARYYRRNRLFDYPQRRLKYMVMRSMLNFLFSFPFTRRYFRKNLNTISSGQYRKVVEKYGKAG